MEKVKQYRNVISTFISSDKGQRFFNFAYSIGAAIVIWGALFKILHLPGGNMLLSIGMGTEVLMFILTAFDRPPKEYKWETVFPALIEGEDNQEVKADVEQPAANGNGGSVTIIGGGTIVAGGASGQTGAATQAAVVQAPEFVPTDADSATKYYMDELTAMTAELKRLRESTAALNNVSDVLLGSYRAITENSENITRSSQGYVEQMQDLNRNIGGLNTIYEIQLKSISSQIDSIDRINTSIKDVRDMYEKGAGQSQRYSEEAEKMAQYMQQINSIYEKMIQAMTVNMYHPAAVAPAAPAQTPSGEQQ